MSNGVLEQIIEEIKLHDEQFPMHGDGCACLDKHAGMLRKAMANMSKKSRRNLLIVMGYVWRNS